MALAKVMWLEQFIAATNPAQTEPGDARAYRQMGYLAMHLLSGLRPGILLSGLRPGIRQGVTRGEYKSRSRLTENRCPSSMPAAVRPVPLDLQLRAAVNLAPEPMPLADYYVLHVHHHFSNGSSGQQLLPQLQLYWRHMPQVVRDVFPPSPPPPWYH